MRIALYLGDPRSTRSTMPTIHDPFNCTAYTHPSPPLVTSATPVRWWSPPHKHQVHVHDPHMSTRYMDPHAPFCQTCLCASQHWALLLNRVLMSLESTIHELPTRHAHTTYLPSSDRERESGDYFLHVRGATRGRRPGRGRMVLKERRIELKSGCRYKTTHHWDGNACRCKSTRWTAIRWIYAR